MQVDPNSDTLVEDARETALRRENELRIEEIETARQWYEGTQYDDANQSAYDAIPAEDGKPAKLPEHMKLIAYSTQIQESVDYIAAQLADSFQIEAKDSKVQEVVDGTLSNSPDLASDDDEDEINVTTQFRDALIAGDIAVHVRWDAEKEMPWFEFWEGESVDFQFSEENRFQLERVILTQMVWRPNLGDGELTEVHQEKHWLMDAVAGKCMVVTFEDQKMVSTEYEPWSFIPWRMWRGQRKKVRQTRGQSVVTKRIRDIAGRYDATEQLSFVIGRYNSHGNLAVVGDSALILSKDDARIRKDVADVLTFPGGTALQVIQLPSDTQMLNHQHDTCLDSIYSAFGLARLDHTTVQGLGQMSGYALEILNRKTDGTFGQIGKQLARDIRSSLNVALDVYAEAMGMNQILDEDEAPEIVGDVDVAELVPGEEAEPEVDVDEVFSDRSMKITLGGGYIVDNVMLRDDYTAKLVSRRYVLEQRGLGKEQIDQIEEEIDGEAPPQPEVSLSPAGAAAAEAAAAGTPNGTAAGQTLNNVAQPAVQPAPANA